MDKVLNWLSNDWWQGIGVISALLIPIAGWAIHEITGRTKMGRAEEADTVANEVEKTVASQPDATPAKSALPRFDIRVDESNHAFVLTNIGGPASNITVSAEATDGTYTRSWNNYLGRSDSSPWQLYDYSFFAVELPKLREERQKGGTMFLDGHVEGGDGKAHYPIKFTIIWDGCPEPKEITLTVS